MLCVKSWIYLFGAHGPKKIAISPLPPPQHNILSKILLADKIFYHPQYKMYVVFYN